MGAKSTAKQAVRKPKVAPEPKPYHHGDLRRVLLDTALVLLREGGVAALTLREVARRAGVTHAAPYRHFEDKEALLATLSEEGFLGLRAALETYAAPFAPGTVEYFQNSGVGYVLFAFSHAEQYRLMFGSPAIPGTFDVPSKCPGLDAAADAAYAFLTNSVALAQARGHLRSGTAEEVTLTAWSMVHGLASLVVDGRLGPLDAVAVEALARKTTGFLVHGVGGAKQ